LEVLKKAEAKLDAAKTELAKASETLSQYTGTDLAERAKLELARDERVRDLQDEDKRYQIAKDLADNLTISYPPPWFARYFLLQADGRQWTGRNLRSRARSTNQRAAITTMAEEPPASTKVR
jgi:hypothetical protein